MTTNKAPAADIPLVDLKVQYGNIKGEIDEAIRKVIEASAFIGGPAVAEFESLFAEMCAVPYCVGVANGTDALMLTLRSMQIGRGDEVIVPANSFIATSEAVTAVGASVVFVDIDPDSYLITAEAIADAISPRAKLAIAVHLYGHPADMDAILEVARSHGLKVIEDAAQAHGAEYRGRRVGSLGDAACFSFYPGKNLGAYGDAGAVVTANGALAERIRMLSNHGRKDKYNHQIEGFNSRLDGLQAAILTVKARHLEDWNEKRRQHASLYTSLLEGIEEITVPTVQPWVRPVYHLYVVRAARRDELKAFLEQNGVRAGIHYPIPLPELEAYKHLGHRSSEFPVSSAAAREILSLPIYAELTEADIRYVVGLIRRFYASS
ncbi:MAG: DegT/DnrJ/EryC1/StrS family aminotransferase [Acidobacteriota bacterium]